MYIIEKKRRRTAVVGIGLSLVMLVVSAMYLKQQQQPEIDTPVFMQSEVLHLPAIEKEEVIVLPMLVNADQVMNYYDSKKSDGELSHALSQYQGVYRPSQSVCYSFEGKVFEVTAMVTGVVKEVYTDALMGKSVKVDCGQGLVITYQSLSSTEVIVGEVVTQKQVIGLAGENSYHEDLGVHVQITAHYNGQLIDPESLIDCKVSELN